MTSVHPVRFPYHVISSFTNGVLAKDLITHLLCVDPTQRYTIDEFLAHPWSKETQGSAQPARTPATAHPLDSPLLQSAHGAAIGRSPGLATLKEAFDITYAVHRMEEEGARRRGANFLGDVNEDDEDSEDSDQAVVNMAKQRQDGNLAGVQGEGTRGVDTGTHMNRDAAKMAYQGGRAGPRDRGDRKKGFELNMGGATLLGYVASYPSYRLSLTDFACSRRRKTPPEVHMAEGYGQRVRVHVDDAGTPMSVV